MAKHAQGTLGRPRRRLVENKEGRPKKQNGQGCQQIENNRDEVGKFKISSERVREEKEVLRGGYEDMQAEQARAQHLRNFFSPRTNIQKTLFFFRFDVATHKGQNSLGEENHAEVDRKKRKHGKANEQGIGLFIRVGVDFQVKK